ncbi:glutaredoxin family protein [Aquabacterium soli]|uniref:Glutaredoxin family protein n=2 Tax=Aquabacterium soli TaxID=2493092 RepID=A0A3R8U649_9BURK|nr:glutaredoxin family protein [Aquabacterium soli]
MPRFQKIPIHVLAAVPAAPAAMAALVLGTAALMVSTPAWALYKVIGPDGKVTYTDRAPTDKPAQALRTNGSVSSTANLPFELRQIAGKYPVTLYTTKDCPPCDSGRQSLRQRGIPFTEKSVGTSADLQALQRLENTQQLPVLRVGNQQVKGYSESEWQSYLDAAGYPKQSALAGYQWADATPLAPPAASAPAAKGPANTREPGASTGSGSSTPPPPTGFRF